jgi:hypothetical protein
MDKVQESNNPEKQLSSISAAHVTKVQTFADYWKQVAESIKLCIIMKLLNETSPGHFAPRPVSSA